MKNKKKKLDYTYIYLMGNVPRYVTLWNACYKTLDGVWKHRSLEMKKIIMQNKVHRSINHVFSTKTPELPVFLLNQITDYLKYIYFFNNLLVFRYK